MKHRIDPKIDCVFKALLGAEINRDLLIHFLNAVLVEELPEQIIEVEILNPHNEREFIDDKLSIIDVKARDDKERMYQIEIQLITHRYLLARIAYGWTDLYSQQLKNGQDYRELRPTYSVWLLGEELFSGNKNYFHDYQLRNRDGQVLLKHGGIWLFELSKFGADYIATEQQRWLKFFKEGEELDDGQLPDWMNTKEMRKAMNTLRQFSEKDQDYHRYQARLNYLREQTSLIKGHEEDLLKLDQATRQLELERQAKKSAQQAEAKERKEKEAARRAEAKERKEKEAARRAEETARQAEAEERQAKESALAEIERLKLLLSQNLN